MNDTILKFGYPKSVIKEYDNWIILLRPEQITLGSLILAHKSDLESLSQIDSQDYFELGTITKDIEFSLRELFGMEKINYLALMMVDKNVHFHIIPRYSKKIKFNKATFLDTGWPKLPDLTYKNELPEISFLKLKEILIKSFI